MPTALRLFDVCGPDFANNELGMHLFIVQRGWGDAYALNPWGASDMPSLDSTIAAGHGFILAWGCGRFKDGEGQTIGHSPFDGGPIICTPRGPGAFARFDEVFGRDGLESWEKETKARADACTAKGLESGIFLGGPRWDAFTPQTAEKLVRRTLDAWTGPIKRAGLRRVQIDSATATAQRFGKETPVLRWAEHLLYEGFEVDGETIPAVTPDLFPWANGRFGFVASPEDREYRSGPGYFNRACAGTAKRRFLWIQGSVPPPKRVEMLNAELANPVGDDVIVDFSGWWSPTYAGGTSSHTASSQTAPSIDEPSGGAPQGQESSQPL